MIAVTGATGHVGRPARKIQVGISYYGGVAAREGDAVCGDYGELTGQAPLTVAQVIAQHRDAMPLVRLSA